MATEQQRKDVLFVALWPDATDDTVTSLTPEKQAMFLDSFVNYRRDAVIERGHDPDDMNEEQFSINLITALKNFICDVNVGYKDVVFEVRAALKDAQEQSAAEDEDCGENKARVAGVS